MLHSSNHLTPPTFQRLSHRARAPKRPTAAMTPKFCTFLATAPELAEAEGPPAEKVAVALPTFGVKTTTVVLGAALRLDGTVMLLVGLRIGLEMDPVPFAAE